MCTIVNDLYDYCGLKIIQGKDDFKFSLDSILLAEFIDVPLKQVQIIDFCTGNAPIPLILSTKCLHKITGVEIQEKIYKIAIESVIINNKNDQIKILKNDVKDIRKIFPAETFDIVSSNPPYFKVGENSIINESDQKAIARHEILINIEDIVRNASYILKEKGAFYLVHRCDRLEEILYLLKKYKFVVKKLQFIYANFDKNAMIVLIKATKNGKIGLKVLKPINISKYSSYQNIVGD